jgi:hypothetical protein
MAQAPYDEADTLDRMRADADQVELVADLTSAERRSQPDTTRSAGLEVSSDAADLGAALHFHLD